MKIVKMETYNQGDNVGLTKVYAEDGTVGIGQLSTFSANITAQVFHQMVAPIALGRDALELDSLERAVFEGNYKFPGSFVCRAYTGLETALWDLRGRLEGKSVAELLGGDPKAKLVPYGSSMSREITPQDEAARMVRLRDEKGFRAFKMRVGSVNGHDQDQWPGRTDALVPTVRQAVGDDIALKVDGNSCYTPAKAIEVAKLLKDNGVTHFEEPCPYWELDWIAEVTRSIDVPVANGEQDYDLQQWKRMTWQHTMDIAQPDICYIGGMSRAMRACQMAADAGMPAVPHSANLSMVTLFTMHLMTAIPNAGPHFEFTIEDNTWTEGLYAPALEVVDGVVALPQGPGWGVQFSESWLAQAVRRVSELES